MSKGTCPLPPGDPLRPDHGRLILWVTPSCYGSAAGAAGPGMLQHILACLLGCRPLAPPVIMLLKPCPAASAAASPVSYIAVVVTTRLVSGAVRSDEQVF